MLLQAKEEDNKVIIDKDKFEGFLSEIESVIETLEIVSDTELVSQIEKSLEDFRKGRVVRIKDKEDFNKIFGC